MPMRCRFMAKARVEVFCILRLAELDLSENKHLNCFLVG